MCSLLLALYGCMDSCLTCTYYMHSLPIWMYVRVCVWLSVRLYECIRVYSLFLRVTCIEFTVKI